MYVKEISFSSSILGAERERDFVCGCNGNFGNYIAITERNNGHSRGFSRRSKSRRNYPGLSYVPTRRSDYVRLSTCAFSLWKEHCNVGTDAEFQRVKLNENVNESLASDMRNSNPIITVESELNGAGIFNNPSDTIIFLKEIRARYHSVHPPRSITVKSHDKTFAKELVKRIILLPDIVRFCHRVRKQEGEKGYAKKKRAENSSTRDTSDGSDGSGEPEKRGRKRSFPCSRGPAPRDFDR